MWSLAAVTRTVHVLPGLHPFRLGDTKGSSRVLMWTGSPGSSTGVAVLTRTGREPDLPTGDDSRYVNASVWDALDAAHATFDAVIATETCWLGALSRMPGAWLPDLAVLPRSERNFDDPATSWPTESVDFAAEYAVYADDARYAADVLAPHVMALLLDRLPSGTSLTIAGDALHVWLRYDQRARTRDGLAQRLVSIVEGVRDAIPSFVFVDHPDRSDVVEDDLEAKQQAAAQYQASRKPGHSDDPTLQRIYDQARAAWEARDVSSKP